MGNDEQTIIGNDNISEPNASSNDGNETKPEFTINEQPIKRGRGRPRKDGTTAQGTKAKSTKKKLGKAEAKTNAQRLMAMFQLGTMQLTKVDTRFIETEATIIETSLSGLLENVEVVDLERYANILNPIMLAVGLGMWGIRVSAMVKERDTELKRQQKPKEEIKIENDYTSTTGNVI